MIHGGPAIPLIPLAATGGDGEGRNSTVGTASDDANVDDADDDADLAKLTTRIEDIAARLESA